MMRWTHSLLLVAGLLFSTAQAQAGVSLVTDKPIGTPLLMDAGMVSSDTMIVSIHSDASDLLQGWQTRLIILPTGGTGSVGFNQSFQPLNYVFGTRGIFYDEDLAFGGASDSLFAVDLSLDELINTLAVTILAPPGHNLLQLDFLASSDATGLFGVFALTGPGLSEYINFTFRGVPFDNFPALVTTLQIGQISITPSTIPEPTTLAIFGFGLAGLGVMRRRRKAAA